MQFRRGHMVVMSMSLLAALAFSSGCGGIAKGSEDRDPNIRRARDRRAVGDYAGALEYYQRAIEKRPNMARVHWEMASIYDQFFTNELRAIYHYERFLEIDPKAERRTLVENLIAAAKLSYAASLPARPSEAVNEIARLQNELQSTRQLLTEAREQVTQLNAQLSARPPAPVASAGPPAAAPVVTPRGSASASPTTTVPAPATFDEYTVTSGDTLSRIASKVYGDANKWQAIYEANKSTLGRPENVRVGQKLKIPR